MKRIRSPRPPIRQSCSSQRSRLSSLQWPTQTNQVSGDSPCCSWLEQDPACHVDEEIGPFSQVDRAAAEHDSCVFRQPELAPDFKPKGLAVEAPRLRVLAVVDCS